MYTVDLDSMDPKKEGSGTPDPALPGVTIFTDGSKSKDNDRTGAGIVFYKDGAPIIKNNQALFYATRLHRSNSVFQTEVWALKTATRIMLDQLGREDAWVNEEDDVVLYSDSQAALKALKAVSIKSKVVMETVTLLNSLALKVKSVTLKWVKGHAGHTGNVRADDAALIGRNNHSSINPEAPLIPQASVNMDINLATISMWRKVWRREPGCSQTRLWFPSGPRPDFAFDIIKLPRVICSQLTQFVTGHCFLNRHQALIDNSDRAHIIQQLPVDEREEGEEIIPVSSALCRRCGDGEEKPYHLMTVCKDLATLRQRIFAHPFPEPPYTDFKVFQIVAFLKELKLPSLEMRPYLEEYIPARIPEEARPSPLLPIVAGAEEVSSSDEDFYAAARGAAEIAGGNLLHNYLVTQNAPPLQDPEGETFY